MIEAEALANGHIAVGVFKRDGGWGMQNARTGAKIKRRIQLIPLGLVVSPKRERVAVFFRGRFVDQIERLFLIVGKFLQYPGLYLSSTVGKCDAVEIVLDNRFRFGSCLFGRACIENRSCWLYRLSLVDSRTRRS